LVIPFKEFIFTLLFMQKKFPKYRILKGIKTVVLMLSIAAIFLTLDSCKSEDQPAPEIKSEINSLAIAINDQLWSGEIGDSLRKKFAAPVDGLPQEEPLFTIQQFPIRLFDANKTSNTNMILIKKEEKTSYKLVQNRYIKPQNLVIISGKSNAEILNFIEENGDSLVNIFRESSAIRI